MIDSPTAAAVRRWVERIVIGEGLCPFARPVFARLRIAVSHAEALEDLIGDVAVELQRMLDTPADELPTTVIAVPRMLADFEDYLDVLDVLVTVVSDAGLEGEIQIASFHPDYRFEGAPADDPANGTNRSPVPLFHLLREDDVESAVASHPDAEGIPARNEARFRALGAAEVARRLAACQAPDAQSSEG